MTFARFLLYSFAFKNFNKIHVVLLAYLLGVPYLFKMYRGSDQRMTWDDYVRSTCLKLHIPLLATKIESTLFKNPLSFETGVSNFLVNTSGELFVDVGAHAGRYTILLGDKYRQIIAIEPEPGNMQFLKSNVKYAGLTNVQFLRCAVSDKDGYADFYLETSSDTHSLQKCSGKGKIRVKTLTLMSVIQDRWTDLVKVDVEGAEWLVLKGAESLIDKIKSWVVELHNSERKKELREWFISHNYSVRWLDFNHIYAWRNQKV